MTIASVVIRLADHGPHEVAQARSRLGRHPWLTLGPHRGSRLAAVVEAESAAGGRRYLQQLVDEPTVAQVDVVSVYYGEEGDI